MDMARVAEPSGTVFSMTGQGSAHGLTPAGEITVEVRSVNGRGLTVKYRLPPECQGFESAFERQLRQRLKRGSVLVVIDVTAPALDPTRIVDAAVFGQAVTVLRGLAETHGLAGDVALGDVLAVPGVLPTAGGPRLRTSQEPSAEILALLDAALESLVEHRAAEGRATVTALGQHVDDLAAGLATVTARCPQVVEEYRRRLLERVNEFLVDRAPQLEDDAVIREVAVFADRGDVREEIDRLGIHISRMGEQLSSGGALGRSLDFLAQEMLREVNTIGSKAADVEIAHAVVAMKSAIDRIKEQAANLE